jgi:hypothetical protein
VGKAAQTEKAANRLGQRGTAMLAIRQEQVQVFRQAAFVRYENKLVEELSKLFPRTAVKLGESGLRETIRRGTRRAFEYGITRECDAGRYVAVTLMFGPNFDSKTSSGSMYSALRDPRFKTSQARADALCEYAQAALKERTTRTGRRPVW